MKPSNRILVLEDDVAIAAIIALLLKPHGWSVHITSKCADALSLIHDQNVDVFLTDYLLPKMNGFQIVENLRSKGSTIPVILMTACPSHIDLNDLKKTEHLNILAILDKDTLVEDLVPVLRKALESTGN